MHINLKISILLLLNVLSGYVEAGNSYCFVNNIGMPIEIKIFKNTTQDILKLEACECTTTEAITAFELVSIGTIACKDMQNKPIMCILPIDNQIPTFTITFLKQCYNDGIKPHIGSHLAWNFFIKIYGCFKRCIPPYDSKIINWEEQYTFGIKTGFVSKLNSKN